MSIDASSPDDVRTGGLHTDDVHIDDVRTEPAGPDDRAAADPRACPACPHELDAHDGLGTRFCAATTANGDSRGCICRAGTPRTP